MEIRAFGRTLIKQYDHFIMSCSIKELCEKSHDVKFVKINNNNISDLKQGVYPNKMISSLICSQKEKCEVFTLQEADSNEFIGTIGVVYKGGNEIEYKVRKIDAFIINVFVEESKRHRGYFKQMMQYLSEHLREQGVTETYLAVSISNHRAISAYGKIGFQ